MTDKTTTIPDQPDGIEDDSYDLPDLGRAAERVREYICAWGDGLIGTADGHPLYARDLEALRRAGEQVDELTAALTQFREQAATHANQIGRLVAALAERDAQLTAANRRSDGLQNDLNSAVKGNTAWANQEAEAKPDGPWKALIVHEAQVADDFSELAPDDEVDIVIVRDSSLPDDEGHMPGTYKTDDVAFEATDIYVDGDGGTDAPTIYARAQVMAAGLNAAEVTR